MVFIPLQEHMHKIELIVFKILIVLHLQLNLHLVSNQNPVTL